MRNFKYHGTTRKTSGAHADQENGNSISCVTVQSLNIRPLIKAKTEDLLLHLLKHRHFFTKV